MIQKTRFIFVKQNVFCQFLCQIYERRNASLRQANREPGNLPAACSYKNSNLKMLLQPTETKTDIRKHSRSSAATKTRMKQLSCNLRQQNLNAGNLPAICSN